MSTVNRRRRSVSSLSCSIVVLLTSIQTATASPPPDQLQLTLPGSIFMDVGDSPSLDQDNDGLKDDMENMLADAWRPFFVFDEEETDLRGNEPVVLFQVRPTNWAGPYQITIKWAFLYARDGGYPGVCTDAHDGDTQGGTSYLESEDGVLWQLSQLEHWDSSALATDGRIEWTAPRQTYWEQLPARPSPKVYASEGKHHQYFSGGACEDAAEFFGCEEDCGGGAKRYANLTPNGAFTNVGEPNHHPENAGENIPFVNSLASFGYQGEYVWYAQWRCRCDDDDPYQDCFTGGKGSNWGTSWNKCTVPSPVYQKFLGGDPAPQPIYTRKRLIALLANF